MIYSNNTGQNLNTYTFGSLIVPTLIAPVYKFVFRKGAGRVRMLSENILNIFSIVLALFGIIIVLLLLLRIYWKKFIIQVPEITEDYPRQNRPATYLAFKRILI